MGNQMDKEEMEGVEELMKQKMMMEMADMMYVYMNFKVEIYYAYLHKHIPTLTLVHRVLIAIQCVFLYGNILN